jgi:preprotein translocase subunit YajC
MQANQDILFSVANVDYVSTIDGNSPMGALYNINRKIVALNEYKDYNEDERMAIDCHEEGHLIAKNDNEDEADSIGFLLFKAKGNTNYRAWLTGFKKIFQGRPSWVNYDFEFSLITKERKKRYKNIETMVLQAEQNNNKVALAGGIVAGAILQGTGQILTGIDQLKNGNFRAGLDHQSQQLQLRAIQEQSMAQVQVSKLNSVSSGLMAAAKEKQTELIVGAIVAVVLVVVFYFAWKSGRAPKMRFPNPDLLPNPNLLV